MQESDIILKILLIGDSGVGKSSIVLRLIDNIYNESYISTIGVDFKIKNIVVDNKHIKVQIWDTAGQERFKTITNSYYRGSHGIFIVYDITSKKSFDNIKVWLSELYKFRIKEELKITIIGNKKDLNDKREVDYEEANQYSIDNGFGYYEISSKDSNLNEIELILNKLCKLLLDSNIYDKKKQIKIRNNIINYQNKNNCC